MEKKAETQGTGGRVCRVVYVVVEEGWVLLHRSEADDFWSLPGGGCEVGETSHEALLREVEEEMGETVSIDRLLWVVENIFTFEGELHHGIELFFKVTLSAESRFQDREIEHPGIEGPLALTFRWFRIDEIDTLDLVPKFLYQGLKDVPTTTQHVVNRELESNR